MSASPDFGRGPNHTAIQYCQAFVPTRGLEQDSVAGKRVGLILAALFVTGIIFVLLLESSAYKK